MTYRQKYGNKSFAVLVFNKITNNVKQYVGYLVSEDEDSITMYVYSLNELKRIPANEIEDNALA